MAVLLVLGVLVLYLVPPLVIESLIAGGVQATLDTTTPLNVKVDSKFPPMMLLGRIDRVQVTVDRPYNDDLIVDLDGVSVSVPSLIAGKPSIEAEKCSTRNIDYNDVADQIQCLQVGE